jgi:hypothetical protein
MVSSVCGSFFKGFSKRGVLLGVMRTRSQFAPLVTMQQAVNVVDGNLLPELFLERGSKLFGGEQVAVFSLRKMLGKEGSLLIQTHQSPASSAMPFAVESGGAKGVVFADPFPNRLR